MYCLTDQIICGVTMRLSESSSYELQIETVKAFISTFMFSIEKSKHNIDRCINKSATMH